MERTQPNHLEIALTCQKYLGTSEAIKYCYGISRNQGADSQTYRKAAEWLESKLEGK